MKTKTILIIVIVSLIVTSLSVATYFWLIKEDKKVAEPDTSACLIPVEFFKTRWSEEVSISNSSTIDDGQDYKTSACLYDSEIDPGTRSVIVNVQKGLSPTASQSLSDSFGDKAGDETPTVVKGVNGFMYTSEDGSGVRVWSNDLWISTHSPSLADATAALEQILQ